MTEVEIKKLLMTVGLCAKAGRLICGTDQICDAMRKGNKAPVLVLEASDTSANTHKRLTDRCTFYSVRHIQIEADAVMLGEAVGKYSAIASVGITDEGFRTAIEKKLT